MICTDFVHRQLDTNCTSFSYIYIYIYIYIVLSNTHVCFVLTLCFTVRIFKGLTACKCLCCTFCLVFAVCLSFVGWLCFYCLFSAHYTRLCAGSGKGSVVYPRPPRWISSDTVQEMFLFVQYTFIPYIRSLVQGFWAVHIF